jgi:hypothetical protein
MGARLYSPATGRFLQVDPVFGGNCNAYDYVCQDPLNAEDLNGLWCILGHNKNGSCRGSGTLHKIAHIVRHVAKSLVKPLAEVQFGVDFVGAVSEVLAVGSAITGDEVGAAFFEGVALTAANFSQWIGAYDVAATCISGTKSQCVGSISTYVLSAGLVTSETEAVFWDTLEAMVGKR